MFNGNLLGFLLCFLIGCGVGFLNHILSRKQITGFFVTFLCALFIGFSVSVMQLIFKERVMLEPTVIGCIVPLLPGVAFTTAVRDAIGDELISGITRAVEALLIAVAIASGVGISLGMSYWIGGLL